jgi:hypothetical protein
MVIEIPRWLDDAIDGQKWTLIGVAALTVLWAGTVTWYVAFAAVPPPPHAAAARAVSACAAAPGPGVPGERSSAGRCARREGEGTRPHPAAAR